MGKKANRVMCSMQKGDVPKTFANVDELIKDYGYSPNTDIKTGLKIFTNWFSSYKNSNK